MPTIIEITDFSAPELDVYARLTEAQLRNRLEPQLGMFIAESPMVIDVALDCGCVPVSFLMERRHITGPGASVIARCPDIPVYTADDDLLGNLTGFPMSRGILCAMRRPTLKTAEELCKDAHRVAVLENIVDVTNIGAIFRSAAALGVDAVLLTPSCADPLNRRAVRVSMGTVFSVPWTYIGKDREDWEKNGVLHLHELGFKAAALALSDQSISIADDRLKREERLALLLGNEGDGLLGTTVDACDYVVKIPMKHKVDSLNVAAASAVAFWETSYEA